MAVTNPPTTTMAIGCSISCPGMLPATTRGTSASPVARAVIRIGASRSVAPRMTSSRPNSIPSSRSSCWKWLTIKMPLRAAMPNTARNPTSEPKDSTAPLSSTATTPPTRAIGSSTKVSRASRKLPSAACSSSRIVSSAAKPNTSSFSWAAFSSLDSPSTS